MQLRIEPHIVDTSDNREQGELLPRQPSDSSPRGPMTDSSAMELRKVQRDTLKKKLEFYQDKLLQIERRNRSIMLRRVYDKWSFDLAKLIIRGTSIAEKVVERAILKKNAICLIPDSDDTDLAEKDRNRFRSLYRNITQLELETGLQETYLGFPFLVGHISQDTYIRGPLVLFPISIDHRKDGKPPGWYLSFSKVKTPIPNRAMIAALKKKGGISLPDSFHEEFEDLFAGVEEDNQGNVSFDSKNEAKDVANITIEAQFVRDLTNLLLTKDFPLRPSNNKMDKVEVLEPLSAEQEMVMAKEHLHFANYKIIGNFPQGDTAIYADYEELMKRAESGETNQGIIDNLLEIPSAEDLWNEGNEGKEVEDNIDLDKIPAKELNLVVESDASQEAVIVAAQSSECTVVRGPPGTGKSQVIVNLISNALANDKKILLVCQKRAALDVVYQRLNKVGLSKYVALLHDPVNDRQELYRQLSKLLNFGSRSARTTALGAADSKLIPLSQSIDNIVTTQRAIVLALRKQYFGGIAAHQLYALSQPGYTHTLDLSSIGSRIQYHEVVQLTDAMKSLESACKTFDSPSYPWARRKSFAALGLNDRTRLIEALEEIARITRGHENITVLKNITQQQLLIDSLRSLATETGMFRKLKPKWGEASTAAKRLLNDPNFPTSDINRVNIALADAERGRDFWNSFTKLAGFLDDAGFNEIKSEIVPVVRTDAVLQRLAIMKESLVNFDLIQEYDATKESLNSLQTELLQICRSNLMDKIGWDEILRQELYVHWIEQIERENPVLKNQPFEIYLANRKRLSAAIKEHRSLVIQKIEEKIESRIKKPATTASGNRSHRSEVLMWSKLADDLDKRRRSLPVRKLIEKYESIMFDLAPCWLASPEAVSSIFPLRRNLFDYVIFDEASQSAVERSLTSLYRGSHIVIMGDEKQLRPFDLFRTKDDEDDEDEIIDDTMLSESLLVLSKRIYGHRYLAWHYRSKYQELIDFSNHAFYDGHLQVAPNVLRSPNVPPMRWINCEKGLWENRQNLPEAVLVVTEIKKILLGNEVEGMSKSIGVITFNESQQMSILDEIDRRRQEDAEFDQLYTAAENPESNRLDDKPFVKNIENVQGDERDIIIFSVGYARDAEGHLRIRFGTLNQEGGENRLNVAITRARKEIVVVCSIEPDELRTDSAKNNGPKRLKDYLRYAKFISECRREGAENILLSLNDGFVRGGGANGEIHNALLFESPFEEIVYERLRSMGYAIDTQVGYSGYRIDLAVVHPDEPSKYILAIECDGATFHSAKSTRERDVMRQEFLESRGWAVERIWSRNWWKNPDRELERIRQKIVELQGKTNTVSKE
jgi:very-short-patch-repair endonuclease